MSAGGTDRDGPGCGAASLERLRSKSGSEALAGRVRRPVLESWKRSLNWQVSPEVPQAHFDDRVDGENPLQRISGAELSRIANDLTDEPVALLVTDSRGVVLARHCGDRELLRRLDRVNLAPGFSYREEHMGTNGIGTALEHGTSILIDGNEHYAGSLTRFSCAGVPILHPGHGRTVGVLDLTLDAQYSNSLVLAMARQVAARIRSALRGATDERDQALLAEFLRASSNAAALIAVGQRFTLLSPAAQRDFCPADQATLLEHAREHHQSGTSILELPSGRTARLDSRAADIDGRPAGAIVRIQPQREIGQSPSTGAAVAGLVGNSTVWRRTVTRALDIRRRQEWLVVEGESGTGKLALLHAVERQVVPTRLPAVLDVATLDPAELLEEATAVLAESRTLIIAHADRLHADQVNDLCDLLAEYQGSARGPFVGLTVTTGDHLLHNLMTFFPHTVRVPALRHHMEDLPELVAHLLGRRREELRFSPAALAQLGRLPWHGNVAEVKLAMQELMRTRRSGVIEPADLPARCRATARRQLTAMEWLERDAIVDALDSHDGSKQKAAAALGMSRATIYRKIREYGLS